MSTANVSAIQPDSEVERDVMSCITTYKLLPTGGALRRCFMLLGNLNRQQHQKGKTWGGKDLRSVMCTDLC